MEIILITDQGLTPFVYGCDRCQDVCPRNQPWLNQDLPENGPLMQRAPDFALETLLTMDDHHYVN